MGTKSEDISSRISRELDEWADNLNMMLTAVTGTTEQISVKMDPKEEEEVVEATNQP